MDTTAHIHQPWNKGLIVGQKRPLLPRQVWSIRVRLELVDLITSLDGYGAAEGWPGWWGLEGPEFLAWLDDQPEREYTILMGANTYLQMSGLAAKSGSGERHSKEDNAFAELTKASKVVFSSTLQPPLSWTNTQLIREDAVEAVRELKRDGNSPMRTVEASPYAGRS